MAISTDDNREVSAQIVTRLGRTLLPNGKTLREQLTVEGISLWDVMTPSMALYYVPFALSSCEVSITLFERIRPSVTYTKHRIINYISRIRNMNSNNEKFLQESSFMFMGFNNYMYKDVLASLAEQLACAKREGSIVIHDGVYSKSCYAQSENIQFQSNWQFWSKEVANEARTFKKRVDVSTSEVIKFLKSKKFNFNHECSKKIIDYAFHWLLHFDLPLLVNQVVLARNIVKSCKPSLLISSDVADIRARVFTLVGMQENIPTLEMQYGNCEINSYEWQFMLADHIAVWGEKSYKSLLNLGIPKESMTITGTTRNDSLVGVNHSLIQKTKLQLGISNDSIVVLFASTYQQKEYDSFSDPELNTAMKKAIFNVANKMDGLKLIVKPHPLENVNETRDMLNSENNIFFAEKSVDIRDLINVCDVFIGLGTTATIDAMIAEKLIICPVFGDWVWSDWVVKSEATLVPRSEKEIEEIFTNVLEGSLEVLKAKLNVAKQIFINKTVYKPDGCSSARISELALAIAKK